MFNLDDNLGIASNQDGQSLWCNGSDSSRAYARVCAHARLVNTENYRPQLQDATNDSRWEDRHDYTDLEILRHENLEDRMRANKLDDLRARFACQRVVKGALYDDLHDANSVIMKCMAVPRQDRLILKHRVGYGCRMGGAFIEGLVRCHNYHVCAFDAPVIAVGRRNQIRQLCYCAKKSDYDLYFGTVTVRHSWQDSLVDLLEHFRKSMEGFWADRQVKVINKLFIGRVTVLEIMFGFEFGFHPHFHFLFVGDKGIDCKEVSEVLESRLLAYYGKNGLTGKKGIAFDFKPCYDIKDYLTKIPCELSLGNVTKKGHGEHYTFFQLAMLCAETKDKSKRDLIRSRLREYYLATKKRHSIQFSRGLLSHFNIEDYADNSPKVKDYGQFPYMEGSDISKLSYEDKTALLYFVSAFEWKKVYQLLDSRNIRYWRCNEIPSDSLVEMSFDEFQDYRKSLE